MYRSDVCGAHDSIMTTQTSDRHASPALNLRWLESLAMAVGETSNPPIDCTIQGVIPVPDTGSRVQSSKAGGLHWRTAHRYPCTRLCWWTMPHQRPHAVHPWQDCSRRLCCRHTTCDAQPNTHSAATNLLAAPQRGLRTSRPHGCDAQPKQECVSRAHSSTNS